MAIEKSGYFDISSDSTYGFTFRFNWNEEYDETSKCSIVTITSIQVLSTVYSGDWYPGGTITINGETLAVMDYNATPNATNIVRVTTMSDSVWYDVLAYSGLMPVATWTSGQISSTSADITVDLTLWRDSNTPKPIISGTQTIALSGATSEEPELEPEVDTSKDKKRFITALALGFLLSKEIVEQRQVAAYLYNGMEFPPIPDEIMECPYVAIYTDPNGELGLYWAIGFMTEPYTLPISDDKHGVENGAYRYADYGLGQVEYRWYYIGETTGDWMERTHWLNWANYDIYSSDGTLYLAASDPVPVFE